MLISLVWQTKTESSKAAARTLQKKYLEQKARLKELENEYQVLENKAMDAMEAFSAAEEKRQVSKQNDCFANFFFF